MVESRNSGLQQFLYIIAAFLITETIVRKFIEVLGVDVSPYALGGLGLLIFFLARSLSDPKLTDPLLILVTVYLVMMMVSLYLLREGFVNIWFLALVVYLFPLGLIFYVIRLGLAKKKQF